MKLLIVLMALIALLCLTPTLHAQTSNPTLRVSGTTCGPTYLSQTGNLLNTLPGYFEAVCYPGTPGQHLIKAPHLTELQILIMLRFTWSRPPWAVQPMRLLIFMMLLHLLH